MQLANFSKLNGSDYVYIVGILVILLFAIAFVILAIFFFNAKKKIIVHNIENDEIHSEIEHDVGKITKRKKANESVVECYERKIKKSKVLGKVSTSVIAFLYIIAFLFIGFSMSVRQNNQQMWFGNTAMLIIQTDSMSQVYEGNSYLEEDGKLGNENRIQQYSLITITKEQKYIDNIKPFDVVAFKMLSSDGKTYITVVHRLIEVTYDTEGTPLYTFRGDANPKSMAGEFQVQKDMIVGVYETSGFKGYKSLGLGYFISYLQSNIGIIILVVAFLLVLLYSILVEKVFNVYDAKYKELLLVYLDTLENESLAENEDAIESEGLVSEESQVIDEDSQNNDDSLYIPQETTKEEIAEKIEQIAIENHIQKEKMMVKKGRIYYRDAYGRFMRLSDYLEMQKGKAVVQPKPVKQAASLPSRKVKPSIKRDPKFRPRDEKGRYIKFSDYEKSLEEKKVEN